MFQFFSRLILKLNIAQMFVLALILRVILMPISGHWDLTSLHQVANHFFTEGPLSFYYTDIAIYPPLTYLTLAVWQVIIKPFVAADFTRWLNDPIMLEFYNEHVHRYFFLLKLMFIPFELGTAYLLSKFYVEEKTKKIITAVWLFNPVVLYVVYLWGTIDIIPTFFTVLGMYLLLVKRNKIGFVMFGIGSLYKIWPLLLLPFAAVLYSTRTNEKVKNCLWGILPFFLIIAPYLRIPNFRSFVLASDRISLIGNAGLYIGFLQWLLIYLLLYIFYFLWVNKYRSGKFAEIFDHGFLVLIFFYITSAFTPQWFIWLLPFLLYQLIKYRSLRPLFFLVLGGYFLVILTFDITLSLGLFAPFEPTLWQTPFVKEIVERMFKDGNRIWSMFRTVNSAFLLWFVYEWYQLKKKNA